MRKNVLRKTTSSKLNIQAFEKEDNNLQDTLQTKLRVNGME